MSVVRVMVRADDAVTRTGITSCLRSLPGVVVASDDAADVAVVVAERLSVDVASSLRRLKTTLGVPVMLVVDDTDRSDVVTAVDCNVVAILPRRHLTGERLQAAVRAATSGGGMMPTSMLGDLIKHVERVHREVLAPHGMHASGLTPREIEVLQLLADGHDTAEIAARLCFSQRAIKKVIYGITTRLNLRNRPHAVAYALRHRVI